MTEGRVGLRVKVVAGLVTMMFFALTARLWYLQVLASEQFIDMASNNSVRLVEEQPIRGRILDSKGRVLVDNRRTLQVTVDRKEMGDREEAVLLRLSDQLDIPVKLIVRRLEDPRYYPFAPIPVAWDVSKRDAAYILELQHKFPGVDISEAPIRTYPEGTLAAHLLGFIGPISAEELKDQRFSDYEQNDIVGKGGVERWYEEELRGSKGLHKYRVDATGESLGEIGSRPSTPGRDLVLSINRKVQRLAEESLVLGQRLARGVYDEDSKRMLKADGGAVVVMDPNTGQILAMASTPGYNPKVYDNGLTQREYDRLNDPKSNYKQLNRAIAGQYPPGSTYKPFIALSALHRQLATQSTDYPCPPTYRIQGDTSHTVWHNWTTRDLGSMQVNQALVVSCDTVFYDFGRKYWVRYKASGDSAEPLQRDLRSLGFGRLSSVDLPGERAGRVPDSEWKETVNEQEPRIFPYGNWFPGDYVNMSIGQGDTLVTPLQLAVAYSAIANGGSICEPHVALQTQRADGTHVRSIKPSCDRKVPFQQLAYVRQALAGVPTRGTAASAFAGFPLGKVPVAGKTGTAEVRPYQSYSWFAAMAPAGAPKYVVVAMVEQGGHGSTTAAPIVRRILEGLFGITVSELRAGEVAD